MRAIEVEKLSPIRRSSTLRPELAEIDQDYRLPFARLKFYLGMVVIRTGPNRPAGNKGESALYGAKSVNVYFFTAYDC